MDVNDFTTKLASMRRDLAALNWGCVEKELIEKIHALLPPKAGKP